MLRPPAFQVVDSAHIINIEKDTETRSFVAPRSLTFWVDVQCRRSEKEWEMRRWVAYISPIWRSFFGRVVNYLFAQGLRICLWLRFQASYLGLKDCFLSTWIFNCSRAFEKAHPLSMPDDPSVQPPLPDIQILYFRQAYP